MSNRLPSVLLALACAGTLLSAQAGQPAGQPAQPAGQPAQPPPVPSPPGRTAPASDFPQVTFRVQVDYVEVDALVTDAQGNPVRDLRREDFEVLEDGKPQKIELFTFFDVPVTRPEQPLFSPTPIEPDVRSNERFEGRLYVIVLDDLHTAPLRTNLVKRAARQFIEGHLAANDMAAVVHLSGRTEASQDFTSNKRLLLDAVDRFMGRKLRSSTLNRIDVYNQQRGIPSTSGAARIEDPEDAERGFNARNSMESLSNVAKFLEGVRGRRKAVLYFSEGIDYDIYDVFNNRDATTVLDAVRDAIGAATRANVAFYTVDPRGLTMLSDEGIEQAGPGPDDPGYGISRTGLLDELRLSQDSLRVLADETGGYAAVNSNDFKGAFDRIVRENSAYYVLGYYPTNDRRDGRFRKIEVRVKRPDVEVRARKGYVAPRGKPETRTTDAAAGTTSELREALNSPVPESGFAMAVTAAPFKGEAPKASVLVTVQLDGRRFRFTEKDGQSFDNLELSLMALDAKGRIQGGDRQTVDLKLRPQTRQAVEAAGFRLLSRLTLAPGRYQLRVGARAANADAVGTVLYDLEVPDFSKEPFSMSGLIVSSNFSAMTPTGRADEQLKEILKTPPTTARDFSVLDTLLTFAEVYDNQTQAHQVDITTTLRADDGRVVFKTSEQRSTDELQGARGGFGYVAQIPLKDVAAGQYVLRVEAQSRLSGTTPVHREALVRVWPVPQRESSAAAAPAPAKVVVNVARGPQSQVETFKTVIARNDQEWQGLWSSLPMRRPAPKVNFENTMIAAVFLGSRPSAGYGIEVVGVKRDGDALVIEYVERTPAEGTASADVITTPYAIAGVPLYTGDVRFAKVEAPRP